VSKHTTGRPRAQPGGAPPPGMKAGAVYRRAAVTGADQTLVLDRVRLVERGSHRQRLEAGGLYRRLRDEQQRARGWRIGAPAVSRG
jgi:hypothetical protein